MRTRPLCGRGGDARRPVRLARGDDRPGSDIDIMIEIEPEAVQDVYAYVGLKSYIAELFAEPVDFVDRAALKPHVRPSAESEAVYAF